MSGKLSVKCLYDALEPGDALPFLRSIIWGLCSPQDKFLSLENDMGKTLILNPLKKRGWPLAIVILIVSQPTRSLVSPAKPTGSLKY